MTIAYWTVLVAILIPLLLALIKKRQLVSRGQYSNSAPRMGSPEPRSLSERAHWAEQNSFEILPGYIGAVIVAHLAGADQHPIDILALVFILSRILYCLCYLKNWSSLRSMIWFVGLLCIVGLFLIAV